jgi:hypothetical protein
MSCTRGELLQFNVAELCATLRVRSTASVLVDVKVSPPVSRSVSHPAFRCSTTALVVMLFVC